VPDPFPVFVYFSDTVKRDLVSIAIRIRDDKGKMLARLEIHSRQWHPDDLILDPVIVTDGKIAFAEFRIPADSIE
jgi:hypothetical protein